jgi:hypothetical protein
MRRDGEEQLVAVRRHLGRVFRADHAAGAAAIVDDDRLSQLRLHGLGRDARPGVGTAARGKGHDEADQAIGISGGGGLCPHQAGSGQNRERAQAERMAS